ncbi:hypothetical protein GE21DRAFT_1307411 [Neurospora crassa]|nr:hypothetical protein GE21DRAFT_1307411 [Neurospora crassa]
MHGRHEGAYGNAVERLRSPQESVLKMRRSAGWSSESRQQIALFADFGAVALAIEPDEPNLLPTLREEK